MGALSALVIGGLTGWLARMLATGNAGRSMVMSMVIGAAGGLVGTQLVSPLLGIALDQSQFSITAMVLSIAGAVGLLGIIDFLRRAFAR